MTLARATLIVLIFALALSAQTKTVAERLGYPADAKLVILHADDLAVAHSEDAASFDALDRHAVSSASIMVPCPWLTEVADYAKSHPDADLGLHLTLNSEWKTYRWGSVASADTVTSLLNPAGTFYSTVADTVSHAKPDQAELELRAQLERALAVGIHPTHLDSHMGTLFASAGLFAAYVKVAHEYHLPFLVVKVTDERARLLSLLSPSDVVFDQVIVAPATLQPADRKSFYLNSLKEIKPGLTYFIVHLAYDDVESRAMMGQNEPFGAAWRQADFDVITSPEFQQAVKDNHVTVIRWRDLQKLVQGQ
jgi:chitin disaccharide deacetylase